MPLPSRRDLGRALNAPGTEDGPLRWHPAPFFRQPSPPESGLIGGRLSGSSVRLEASFELMEILLKDAELRDVLSLLVERAYPMAGARMAFIALPGEAVNTLTVDIATGLDADRVRGLTVRTATSVIGRVFTSRRALASRVATEPALKGLPVGPILLLPLDTGERTCGVLGVTGRPGDMPFSASAKRELLVFATTSATMIELAEERRAYQR